MSGERVPLEMDKALKLDIKIGETLEENELRQLILQIRPTWGVNDFVIEVQCRIILKLLELQCIHYNCRFLAISRAGGHILANITWFKHILFHLHEKGLGRAQIGQSTDWAEQILLQHGAR